MNKALLLALAAVCLMTTACRRDMQVQPKYSPLSRSWFYPDGRSARPTPAGTIAIDEVNLDPALDTGSVDGKFVTTFPINVDSALLARGQNRYNIYCTPCHGANGYGRGMIALRGFQQPANLNGERIRNAPPGYIYQVIGNGYGAMAAFNYQLKSTRDRWAIVSYIRALELSHGAKLNDLSEAERTKLEAQR